MDILTYINRMNQLYGNDTQVASDTLNIPAHMEHQFEGGQLTPEEFYQNQSIPITERPLTGAEGGRVYDTRKYFKPGGLVEPGVTHYATTDIGIAGGKAGAAKRKLLGLKPHEVTAFRRLVEKSAKNRGREGPNWTEHPGRGYASNTPGNDMAKDIKRRLVGSRKTDIKKIGVGSGTDVEGKILSKVDQDKIKKRFGSTYEGEWNFKTKKNPSGMTYGISNTGKGNKNYDLGQKVRNFILGQHGPNFAFDAFDSANYHLTQMHRAANAKVPNKNYRPIYSTKGIIGYKDLTQNGKEYYHADYKGLDSNQKKALLINKNHPDAAEINKLIEIVEGTKQDRTVLDDLFKKHGYKTPTFNQLLDSLMETEGRWDISSAIEKHHQYGVGREPGSIKLVTRDQNQFAKLIEKRVDTGKMTTKTAHELLKPMGVQIVRDGQKIGAPDIDPTKQMADYKKWITRKAKTNPEQFLKQSIASQIRTMDGETISAYKAVYPDCFKSQGGKNAIACLSKQAENDPKKFARNSANIAKATEGTKSSTQMINFLKKFRKLGKGAGLFAVGEAAFAPLIGIPMWAQGAPKDEILHMLTWGAAGKEREDKILERMSDAGRAVYKAQNLEGEIMRAQETLENAPDAGYQKLQAQRRLNDLQKEYEATISMLQNPDTGKFNPNLVDKGFEEINEATTYFQNIQSQQQKESAAWMAPKVSSVMEKVVDKPASAFTNLVLGPDWKKNLPQHPSSTKYPHSPATLGQHLSYDVNQPMFNSGGRVPFKLGGSDKGRRAFMKLIATLTGAGVAAGTGLLKWGKLGGKGKTVIKAGDHIIQGTAGMPDWFVPLVNRITSEGKDVTAKLGTKSRETVHTKKIGPNEEVTVYHDLDTGNIRVAYGDSLHKGTRVDATGKEIDVFRASNDPGVVHLEYKAPEVIESGKYRGDKTKSEFSAAESEPEVVNWDGDIEWSGINEVNKVDDLVTDTSKLKQFGTKKKLNIKDRLKAEKKQKYRQKLEEDTMEQVDYIEKKHPERATALDDVYDDMYDEFGNIIE